MAFKNFGKRTLLAGDLQLNRGVDVLRDPIVGTSWFVDGVNGADTNSGKTWGAAFLTMSKAFTSLSSGDRVFLKGRVREQLDTPAQIFDVGIYGVSHNTRHPDATPAGGETVPARWDAPASPTASTPLLNIRQQGWYVSNVLFTGDSANTVDCIQLYRDSGSGNSERDASHTTIANCRFQGGRYGVVDNGGVARARILDNEFMLFSSSGDRAITQTGTAIGTKWGWIIDGNDFHANLTDIQIALAGPRITNNHFHLNSLGVTNTAAIILYVAAGFTGGTEELVARNFMYCDSAEASVVNARFTATATGIWGPNYYSDKEEYGEPAE